MNRRAVLTLVVLAAATSLAARVPDRFEIHELPTLSSPPECSPNSNATAINERGDVVGVAESANFAGAYQYQAHAVIWRNGQTIIDLGGIPPNTDWGGSGKGINDNGDAAVGWGAIELAGGGGTAEPSSGRKVRG